MAELTGHWEQGLRAAVRGARSAWRRSVGAPPVSRTSRRVAREAARQGESGWAAADRAVFELVARRDWPGPERVLPRLSRSADKGRLWYLVAAGIAASRTPRARRSAVRGLASLAVASAAVNTLGKGSVRRPRPVLEAVPLIRQLQRQPVTTSFPSGHAASAAAFAAGVALESPRWGAAVAPLAASVAFSRVYTGVHYPSDVLAGAALGVGAAFAVRGLAPTRSQLPSPGRPLVEAPALAQGDGLVLVANASSGGRTEDPARGGGAGAGRSAEKSPGAAASHPEEPPAVGVVREMLPKAEVVCCDPAAGGLAEALDRAAALAAERNGALGVCGGDGTVNCAAGAASRYGVPLAVLPGGTHNHFAFDLGIEETADTCRAVLSGDAVAVDLGRFTAEPDDAPRPDAAGDALVSDGPAAEGPLTGTGYFLNTFSLGSYPDLVRIRERWAHRIGPWPAGVLAAVRVLRTGAPVRAGLGGEQRTLWLLFAGNCAYRVGLAPVRRQDLADGQLDVRLVKAGRWGRTRLLIAALTSAVDRSPLHSTARLRRLEISDIPPGTAFAYDGEVAEAPRRLLVDKLHEALTVYRPAD